MGNPYDEHLGCGDRGCFVRKPTGQATNGGCRCFDDIQPRDRARAMKEEWRRMQARIAYLESALWDILDDEGSQIPFPLREAAESLFREEGGTET